MANITENTQNPAWSNGIYQIETSDPVLGGENGIANRQAKELAARTQWLKTELTKAVSSIGTNKSSADSAIALKANRTIQITAGAGLTGGGDLSANRTIGLATPSTLSGSTANWVGNGATGHTHQLAAATATVAGVVKLINTLDSTAVDAALTAAKGKELSERITALDNKKVQLIQDSRSEFMSGVRYKDATPAQLPIGIFEGFTDNANLIGSGNGTMKIVKLWQDSTGSSAIYREGKLPTGETWRQYANASLTGWNAPFRVDGATFAQIRDKPTSFAGYGISGNQTLAGNIELSGNYPSLTLKSTATGATKKWLFEAGSGGNAYFVRRDYAANTGGDILNLPQRAGTLAVNEEVVKLTENQEIAGVKTFTSAPKITGFNALNTSAFSGWRESLIFSGANAAITLDSRYSIGINNNGNAYFFDTAGTGYAVSINYAARTLTAYGDVIVGSHRLTQKANATDVTTQINTLRNDINNLVPSGTVVYFLGTTAPTGWLKANGAAVSRTTYARLFAVIGTTYGAGDGSTTFNLPDLRGEFIRGFDDGRNIDKGRAFGSHQDDAFQGHARNLKRSQSDARMHGLNYFQNREVNDSAHSPAPAAVGAGDNWLTHDYLPHLTYGTPRVAAETRPRNIALLACIKI